MMKIAVGSDHAALTVKNHVIEYLQAKGHEVVNFGTDTADSVDYPVYGEKVARAVAAGECERGIVVCGTGVGISLAANKVKGIRCVVCSETYTARYSRLHNNTNMLAFGARVVGPGLADMLIDAFLETPYEGGRHERRVQMIKDIEERG